MRNQQLENRKRLLRINEQILREQDLIEDGEVLDPREEFVGQTFRIDRRRKSYFDRIQAIANLIQPAQQISNSIEPDFEIYFPNMVDALYELRGLDINLRWENINRDMKVPQTRNQIRIELRQIPWLVDSETTCFEKYRRDRNGDYPPAVEVSIINDVERVRLQQSFREGINHCVFTPIKDYASQVVENAKSIHTKRKYKTMYNKIIALEKKYEKGVPEEDIQEVCNILQIGLEISLPILNDKFILCRSMKKPLKTFKFINTKKNHIDLGEVVGKNNTITLDSYEDLLDKRDELEGNNEYYVYTKGKKNIKSIITLHNKYIVKSEYHDLVTKFEFDTGLVNCKLDHIDDEEISMFVREGTHYNCSVDINYKKNTPYNARLIDQEKAYFNCKKSKYYNGFLGKITDYRKTNIMLKDDKGYIPAMYRICDLDFSNCKYTKLLNKLKCYVNYNIYPSCELEFLLDIGISFNVIEGCWGVERLDFDFPEEFKKKVNGSAYYAIYVGSCYSMNLTQNLWLKGDRNFFENLKSYTNKRVCFNDDTLEGCVSTQKQNSYHLSQLTAFVTSLQRLTCIEQMMKFNYDQLLRVNTDGIYFTGDIPDLVNLFREKYDLKLSSKAGDEYCSNITNWNNEWNCSLPEFRENKQEELHLGPGGTGKTFNNLKDEGLCRVLYVAPSYKLASTKQEEFKVMSTCWEQLLCKDPNIWSKYKQNYNTFVFDEVSMMSKNQLEVLRKRYTNCKVILCGDIGYQLPCVSNEKCVKVGVEKNDFKNIVYYTENRRVECDKLKSLLSVLRENMQTWGGHQYFQYILDNYKDNILSKVDNYNIQDYILTWSNNVKDKYTEMFKGTFEEEKYMFKERYGEYCNGSIAILPKDNIVKGKKEIRHAFTIHSIQGETISLDRKLFIDLKNFNYAQDGKLLYTAISRAKKLEQIHFVVN